MLYRIYIQIEVPRLDYEKFRSDRLGESSADIRAWVDAAHERQRARFANSVDSPTNPDMCVAKVMYFRKLDEAGESLERTEMNQLSVQANHRILILARTIGELVGSEAIQQSHIVVALQYRSKYMMGR